MDSGKNGFESFETSNESNGGSQLQQGTKVSKESKEESESEQGTEDAEPEVIVKKRVGRPKKNDPSANNKGRKKLTFIDSTNGRSTIRSKVDQTDLNSYEVEDIIDFCVEDKIKYFLIRWKGYDSSVDSWAKERSLNCPELIATFYEKHPEAAVPTVKRKPSIDSDYEVSSDNSVINLSALKRSRKILVPKTRKRQNGTSYNESSDDEVGTEESEPEEKTSVVSVKKLVGRPRKYDLSEEEDNYEVEDIIDFKIEDGIKYFLIRWKGYDPSVDSWEKLRSLNCIDLIAKFYEEHPEARISAKRKHENLNFDKDILSTDRNSETSKSDSDNSNEVTSDASDDQYEPTPYEQSIMENSNSRKKKRKTLIGERISSRHKNANTNYDEEESESEVDTEPETKIEKSEDPRRKKNLKGRKKKKSVERPRKETLILVSNMKKSTGRPRKLKKSVGRPRKDSAPKAKKSPGRPKKQSVSRPKKKSLGRPKKKSSSMRDKKSARKIRDNRTSEVESEGNSEVSEEDSEETAISTEESEAGSADSQPLAKRAVGRPKKQADTNTASSSESE